MRRRRKVIAALILIIGVFITAVFLMKFIKPGAGPSVEEKESPVFVLVLDDFGYTKKNLDALRKIGIPLTLAVLPNVPYSGDVCSFAGENGLDVILHMPMEPKNDTVPIEENTICGDMTDECVRCSIKDAFSSVCAAGGMSNHMGSKATGDRRLMEIVFDDLRERKMFFLDSYTTKSSVCEQAAQDANVPYLRRDIFIDNELDEDYIKQQMEKAGEKAFANGMVIAIGHDRGVTVDVLREVVPAMKKQRIRFVKLSDIVKMAESE